MCLAVYEIKYGIRNCILYTCTYIIYFPWVAIEKGNYIRLKEGMNNFKFKIAFFVFMSAENKSNKSTLEISGVEKKIADYANINQANDFQL